MSNKLKDKIVLITGASSGFGADAARLFAREGSVVLLAARRIDRMNTLAEEIHTSGGEAHVLQMDIANREQVSSVVQDVLGRFGHVDILFNNAGFGRLDWLENLDLEADIEPQISTNLTGLIHLTRLLLPSMLRRHSGIIINMSSMAGWISAPLYSVYAATKHGVRGFTDALRRETAPFGVQVCGIYPGGATTEFGRHTGSAPSKKVFKAAAFLNMTSEYVARKVVNLARRPRARMILPWWFHPVIWFERNCAWLVDWILKIFFVRRIHNLTRQ